MGNLQCNLNRPTRASMWTWLGQRSIATISANRVLRPNRAMVNPRARRMQKILRDRAERRLDVHVTPVKGLTSLAVSSCLTFRLTIGSFSPDVADANPPFFQATNDPVKDASNADYKTLVMMESAKRPNTCMMRQPRH